MHLFILRYSLLELVELGRILATGVVRVLKQHIQSHSARCLCSLCGKVFNDKSNLKQHSKHNLLAAHARFDSTYKVNLNHRI